MAKSYLNRSDVPRGISNNNPGNIRINKANDWKGQVPEVNNLDGEFEQFYQLRWGLRALMVLLRNYIKGGDDTVQDIMSRWAPSHENPTSAYVNFVTRKTGFSKNQTLSPTKPVVTRLAWAIVLFENGATKAKRYISKQDIKDAYSLIRNTSTASTGPVIAAGVGAGMILLSQLSNTKSNG